MRPRVQHDSKVAESMKKDAEFDEQTVLLNNEQPVSGQEALPGESFSCQSSAGKGRRTGK